jgi:predicted nucleic acid-binding protein
MIYILDASALLRFTDKEPGFDRVRNLLYDAAQGSTRILLSAVNWGEIVTVLYRKDSRNAEAILANLAALPITVVPVDANAAAEAGKFKWAFNVPYADAFAGALTLSCAQSSHKPEAAALITADYDFKSIPKGTIKIEFLPVK